MSTITIPCPYCNASCEHPVPKDYSPMYHTCHACGKRFIVERTASGYDVFRENEAPCCSDPECRELELGLGDD